MKTDRFNLQPIPKRKDPFDPENFPTEEELEEQAKAQLMRDLEDGIQSVLKSGRDPAPRRVEIDITGLNFEAVARTIEMMPGGCELKRDGDSVFIEGFDPDFVVWGATQQGYIRGKK